MSTGEKLLILLIAVLVAAVLVATIYVAARNVRTRRRANRVHNAINKLR